PFKTLYLLNFALMKRHDYDITSSLRRGALQLWYQSQMVNTRTDADLSAAVQNALQTLLPQIRAEIREEFLTSSGPSNSGEIPHRSLFILGLNALISKSPVHLRRRQLLWTQRIGSLTWRRSLMSWVIHAEIREEFRTSSGSSDAGGNPPPTTIHTWLERFNKQKPYS
nr:zinc finger, CCHC-type, retrotransposon Gag domain protein [Tanacetum cinerariifolium]